MGCLLLIIVPPIAVPDENTHFYNAYSISMGNIFPTLQDGELVKEFPEQIINFVEKNNSKYAGNLDEKITFEDVYFSQWGDLIDISKVSSIAYWNVKINPVNYLIASIGIYIYMFVSKLLGNALLTPYNLLLIGRLSNYIFYVVVVYYTIKIIPKYKYTLFYLSLMPMSVFLACSLSYDSPLIAINFLLFAIVLRQVYVENIVITKYDIGAVVICTIFLAAIKQVYLSSLLLLLLIPKEKFGGKIKYIRCIFLTIGSIAITYYTYKILYKLCVPEITISQIANLQQLQVRYLFTHPSEWLVIIMNSFRRFWDFYLVGFWGILGQLDTNFPPIFIGFFLGILFLIVFRDSNTTNIEGWLKTKIIAVLIIVMSTIGIFLGTYITWTSHMNGVGVNYVNGVQGRYFIELAPILALLGENKGIDTINKFLKKYDGLINNGIILLVILMDLVTVLILTLRYWI